MAAEAIVKSREIRQEAINTVDHTHQLQQAAHDTIHESFIKKIAHTVTLTVIGVVMRIITKIKKSIVDRLLRQF